MSFRKIKESCFASELERERAIERERERACVSGGVGNLRNLFRRNAITWRSPNEDFALVYLRSPSGDQKDMSITIPEGLHEEVDQQIHWYLEK